MHYTILIIKYSLSRTRMLYRYTGVMCYEYRPTTTRPICYGMTFQYSRAHRQLPAEVQDAERATALLEGQTARFQGSAPQDIPPVVQFTTIRQLITSWDAGWLLHQSIFPDEGLFLAQALARGDAYGVSDGSYMPQIIIFQTAVSRECVACKKLVDYWVE